MNFISSVVEFVEIRRKKKSKVYVAPEALIAKLHSFKMARRVQVSTGAFVVNNDPTTKRRITSCGEFV
jgi:hypothetical protein